MTYAEAIARCYDGAFIARRAWGGGSFVSWVTPASFNLPTGVLIHVTKKASPCFLHTSAHQVVFGWRPTADDSLVDDWQEINPTEVTP